MSTPRRLQYGTTAIDYLLSYADRETLEISVHPDLRVTVVAPQETAMEAVEEKIRKRAPWIIRQQRDFESFLPPVAPREYVSGETHLYLGRQYRLKVLRGFGQKRVRLVRGYLLVETTEKADAVIIGKQVDAWYRTQAQRVFPERLSALLPRLKSIGVELPQLQIRKMEKRWGSCTKDGTITLNLRLMQVPKECLDYVIVHELCHLVEHNHSRRFYALLDWMMKDWRGVRIKLNEMKVA